ncbi:hypothetical protein [Desulfonatronum thiodismutans]|uniref:hypothetical protein n=1 Tax=Desulfonatronum thiodismutans TaxID=159290 RepID=UPI0004ABD774|nr:hypothetical protein [Desulfonatronum thiodismutans]
MALSDLQRLVVFDTANQLWQQDMLMNAYFHGSSVGANLRSMILGRQPVQPLTNPFDEAITGKLRADSRTIRQNARNVKEAGAMMGIAKEAVSTLKGLLKEMEALAKKVKEERDNHAGPDPFEASSADKKDYEALRNRITSTVESTRFNNIALLDASQWDSQQITSDGKVHIQGFPDGGFDLNFRALNKGDSDFDWDMLTGVALEADPDAQLQALSGYIGDMTLIEDIYTRREDGLEYQASALVSQADLLDQAVEARRHVPTKSLEQILLDLLFRNSGRIVDETG